MIDSYTGGYLVGYSTVSLLITIFLVWLGNMIFKKIWIAIVFSFVINLVLILSGEHSFSSPLFIGKIIGIVLGLFLGYFWILSISKKHIVLFNKGKDMYCKNCGIKIIENTKFCRSCGYGTKGVVQTENKETSFKRYDHKSSKFKKVILIISLIILVGLIFVALYSYFYPSSKLGYRTLFIDNTSHTYQKDKPFKYGDYEFTLKPTMKSLGEKENCPSATTNSARIDWVNWDCLFRNQEKEEKEQLDIQMDVKNISKTTKSIKKDYFKIEIEDKVLDNNKDVNFYFKDNVDPNESSSNTFDTKVKKGQEKIEVLITLPNRATQIIKIN